MHESALRDYLARNLDVLDPCISLIETEHTFPGGRIDILARRGRKRIAIELKAKKYRTQHVCAQLMNYLQYAPEAWFVAPKVNYGVYSTLQSFHRRGRLSLYEISSTLQTRRVGPLDLDDRRPFPNVVVPQKSDVGWLLLKIGLEWLTRST